MKLSDQVCSLEYAKKLKKIGVKQESLFYWGETLTGRHAETEFNVFYFSLPVQNIISEYSAFTFAELLELLPHRITLPEGEPYNSFRLRMEKGIWIKDESIGLVNFYSVNYYCDTTSQDLDWIFSAMTKNMSDENPNNAVAKMLIYLLEEGLVKNDFS